MSDETSVTEELPEPPQTEAAGEEASEKEDFLTRILDQLLDLLQTARDWVRQEAEAVVKEKVVPPLQQLGITVAAAWAAAVCLVIGLIFVAVAFIVFLCQWLGVPLAFFVIGLAFLIGAGVFTYIKVKGMQNES